MVVGDNELMATKMQANYWQIQLPWQGSGTTRVTSHNGAYPGLQLKPLDADMG